MLPEKDVQHQLDIIRKNHYTDVKERCGRMFELWLQVDVAASWNKLIEGLRRIKKYHLVQNIVIKVLEGNLVYSYIMFVCNIKPRIV